tara:strand:- start:66 stop:2381 length:2316 start_codon:yes stop_codon:yes gene_type:complete
MLSEKINLLSSRFFSLDKYWRQYSIITLLVIIIAFLFPSGNTLQYSYQLNDITQEPIIAPVTFAIQKSQEQLKIEKDLELKSVPFIFHRRDDVVNLQINRISNFFKIVNDIHIASKRLEESTRLVYERRYHKQYEKARSVFVADSAELDNQLNKLKSEYPFVENNSAWGKYLQPENNDSKKGNLNLDKDNIIRICRNRWSEGIYDISINNILSEEITINQGDVPELVSYDRFNDLEMAWTLARKELLSTYSSQSSFKDLGYDLIVRFMKPNIKYDLQATEKVQNQRLKMIPKSRGVILKDEMIVDANTRITNDVLQKLNSLSFVISKKQISSQIGTVFLGYMGRIILLSVIFTLFYTFLIVYRPDTFHDWKMVLLISIIFFLQIILAYIFVIRLNWSELLIPVTVGAMALAILFDVRIGLIATTSMVVLMTLMMGQNIDFVIISLFTSTIAVYNIRDIRKRSQLFITMFSLMGASVIVVLGLGLFKEHGWLAMLGDIQLLLLNSLFAPLLTYGFIHLFEIGFGVTTDLSLIELLDYNHPLLKKAQQETNGTFNHSIVVGNLAESCAAAIGAHALLCRVGAFYHDIGKMVKSDYFIENQYLGENPHDSLTATMSAKIIRSHVNDGLALAKEYGLPKIVSDFIPMHHGTTRVEYFYRMALKQESNKNNVDENQFRYPGPKPNTKETGILMICEAVEAAVRSIKNPDIIKIEAMINKIIKERIDDGQLDECPLTLAELKKIVGTVDGNSGMLSVLRGIYHIRIEYPDKQIEKTV